MTSQQNRLASDFLDHAVEFARASERLASKKPFLLRPTFYCALHAIELALKSHLAAAGYTKSRLSRRLLAARSHFFMTEIVLEISNRAPGSRGCAFIVRHHGSLFRP